jgi:L-amino acid N-acyltransferase YncA
MDFRAFDEADWPDVLAIFRSVVDAGETYAYDPDWTDQQAHDAWVEPVPGRTVVAINDGRIVGTAHLAPNRPAGGSHVGTASFMVAPEARGQGVGRALGEHILELARADGYASMQFNAVVESNSAAVHLWQDLGFEIIATVPEAFEHPTLGRVGLHIMYQRL